MRPRTTFCVLSTTGALLCASSCAPPTPVVAQTAQAETPADPRLTFAVRADPRLADKVNAVLARLAVDVERTVPVGTTATALIDRLCGGRRPSRVEVVTGTDPGGAGTKVRFSPCVSIRRNVEVVVDTNNTLEGFAVRNGLSPTATSTMKIVRAPDSSPARVITPETLLPNDRVLIPEVPQWTSITTNSALVLDRSSLVSALAAAIGCFAERADECLTKRGVVVLDRATKVELPRPTPPPPPSPGTTAVPRALPGSSGSTAITAGATSVAITERAAIEAARSAQAVTASLGAISTGVATAIHTVPVAPDQWPYDAKLLAAALEKQATDNFRAGIVIGIAEGGLAAADGTPLSRDMFDTVREDDPEPDNDDDDDNSYVDDLIGGAPFRAADPVTTAALGSGDIGLCKTGPPAFPSWKPRSVEFASHGAIVASVAAGLRIRAAVPSIAGRLPKIAFYRMLDNVCADDADFSGNVDPGDMVLAFDYLDYRSQIINMSYRVSPARAKSLVDAMKANLTSSNKLLVLPAGNDSPGDLDKRENLTCPACLGDGRQDSTMALRTVVVGSATRELRRQPYSNHGTNTVWIYAPGEATGAVDVRGRDASGLEPGTSYSAPYAALAAGIMWSLGIDDVKRVKDRLDVATWPLFQETGGSDPRNGGVLDLVKAAAVRLHAIDVKEKAADETFVRRTYVGTLIGPLGQLALCDGRTFVQSRVQAVRFETGAFGDRQVRTYPRDLRDSSQHKWSDGQPCRLPTGGGTVRLKTLEDTEKVFPVSSVMQIQLPWSHR